MKSLIFFLALALVIFHATGLRQFSQLDTEKAIELRSADRLNGDLAEIEVSAQYRDAILRGKVDTVEEKMRAEELVREVIPTGRNRLRNEIQVVQERASSLVASMTNGVIEISGVIPSATVRKQLVDAAESLGKGHKVQSTGLQVDEKADSEPWLAGMPDFVKAFLTTSTGGRIEVGETGLRLSGKFEKQTEKDRAMNRAQQLLPAAQIFDETTVIEPQDASLFVTRSGGTYKVAAMLPATAAGRNLVSNLVAWDKNGQVNLEPGMKDVSWVSGAWEALNGFFGDVPGDASVRIGPDGLVLKGEVLSAGKKRQAEAWFNGQNWRNLAVNGKELGVKPATPFQLEIVSKGGLAMIGGTVGSQAQQAQIVTEVGKTGAKVSDNTKLASGIQLPSWWAKFPELAARFIEAADDASLKISKEEITISGMMKTPGGGEAFKQKLAAINGLPTPQWDGLKWPTQKSPVLALTRKSGNEIVLSGNLGSAQESAAIQKAVAATETGKQVKNEIETDSTYASAGWVRDFPKWWAKFREQTPNGSFEFKNNEFHLVDGSLSPRKSTALASLVKDAFGSGVAFKPGDVKPQTPPSLTLKRVPAGVVLSGKVATAKQRDAMIAAVRASEPGASMDAANFKADPAVKDASWIDSFAKWWPDFRGKVPDATLSIAGGVVKAEGRAAAAGQDKAAEKLLAGVFGNAPKNSISIQPKLEKSPWLKMVADSKTITISGLFANQNVVKTVTDIVEQLPGTKDYMGLLADAGVKEASWAKPVAEYARDLVKERKTARIEVQNGVALVEAMVADAGQENRMELAFNKAVGPGFKIDSRLKLEVGKPAQLTLKKQGNDWLLIGRVPTTADQKRVEDAVKKTDPSAKTQVAVEVGASRPKWLAEFPNWWPRYRKEVPEGLFSVEGDKDPEFEGTVADARSGRDNAANLLTDVFGKRMKFDWKLPTLNRSRLSLRRSDGAVVLDGMVPTVKFKEDVEAAVTKTDAKVTSRIVVEPNLEEPDWLTKFGEWWPKLRQNVPDATFTLDDENNSEIGGEADEAARKRLGGIFAGVFGSKTKLPKMAVHSPAPTKAPWLRFQADSSKIVVTGQVADHKAKQQIESALGGFQGKVDTSGLKSAPDVKPESWTREASRYVTQLVASAGPSTLNLRDGKADIDATVKSESERDQFLKTLGRAVGGGFQINDGMKVGNDGDMSRLNLVDLLPKEEVYFPKNSSYYSRPEKEKIQRYAERITKLNKGDITVYLIGHADARGRSDYNEWLSQKRADRVGNTLARYGVEARFVRVEALGEADAAPLKAGESAWSKDRRVDIRVGKTQ